jgi:hypothetical protein
VVEWRDPNDFPQSSLYALLKGLTPRRVSRYTHKSTAWGSIPIEVPLYRAPYNFSDKPHDFEIFDSLYKFLDKTLAVPDNSQPNGSNLTDQIQLILDQINKNASFSNYLIETLKSIEDQK